MRKESNYTQYIEWAIMIVLFLAFFKLTKDSTFLKELKPETTMNKYVLMISLVIIAFIVLAVHELGHLIMGLIVGFRFEMFVVGPLGIKREDSKIKVYLNKELSYYGGVAATSPMDDHEGNAKKFGRILLAGPIASIIFAIICFALMILVSKSYAILFYASGFISVAIFIATTVPSKTGIFFTDRKRYQRLTTPGPDQEVELAMLKIMGNYTKHNSYKNVNPSDIQILVADDYPFIKYYGLFNLVCYELKNKGVVETSIMNEYTEHSKTMSKNLVKAFDKEIEKLKVKIAL